MTLDGVQPIKYIALTRGSQTAVEGQIVEEALACVSVNGKELASFMCSPSQLDQLALGFLYNENVIDSMDDIAELHISKNNCVDVWLNKDFTPPERLIVTAGCGGGVTFEDFSTRYEPLESNLQVSASDLADRMQDMLKGAERYQAARGIHTSALATADEILLQTEDIGRHNTLDRLRGAVLQAKIDTKNLILFSSGRISSEMLNKARQFEVPIVVSRTSPTSLSVGLAREFNITIVAYLRGSQMRVYTHADRIES